MLKNNLKTMTIPISIPIPVPAQILSSGSVLKTQSKPTSAMTTFSKLSPGTLLSLLDLIFLCFLIKYRKKEQNLILGLIQHLNMWDILSKFLTWLVGFLLCLLVWESNKYLLNGFCVFVFFFLILFWGVNLLCGFWMAGRIGRQWRCHYQQMQWSFTHQWLVSTMVSVGVTLIP